jgi:hypothetical protein
MLRLALLLLYLFASSSTSQDKQGGSLGPLGIVSPTPTADAGAGNDPNGLSSALETDAGAGNDPNG